LEFVSFLQCPGTKEKWEEIAAEFKNRWQFNNCGGALDDKYVRLVPPSDSGALYYNYKNFYSIILMALFSTNYEVVYVNVGKQGRMTRAGVLEWTSFYDQLKRDKLNFPTNEESDENSNFMIIGYEMFAVHGHILKPYSQKDLTHEKGIFNFPHKPGHSS
jgi:hypothetical protein